MVGENFKEIKLDKVRNICKRNPLIGIEHIYFVFISNICAITSTQTSSYNVQLIIGIYFHIVKVWRAFELKFASDF